MALCTDLVRGLGRDFTGGFKPRYSAALTRELLSPAVGRSHRSAHLRRAPGDVRSTRIAEEGARPKFDEDYSYLPVVLHILYQTVI